MIEPSCESPERPELPKVAAYAVACPFCGAAPGMRCRDVRNGEKRPAHVQRFNRAVGREGGSDV